MFRRLLLLAVVAACALPARAGALTTLLPGVTYERTVEFTPHGPVVLNVLTAPRPGDQNGLYQLAPVLAHATVLGAREPVTQIERDVSAQATVAGINGDLFGADGHPAGIFMSGGVLAHKPFSARSSIGVDAAGVLHVDRVKFFGTWRGTGQRRTLDGLNQVPVPGQVVLLTPAFGAAAPVLPGSAEVVLQSFPATVPNADLSTPVTAVGTGGGESIPPGGAIIQAAGPLAAAKLQAEAPVGAQVATRLILQPPEPGVVAALGGGPVLVRNSAPVFRALEDFTSAQIAARSPRAAVGQLADGRIILAAVDGDQAGYSIGLTSFELAQTMARLGAVTASALESGPDVTMAFDGQLLNAPSAGGERAVREALLVQYYGVYAPPPPLPLLTGEPGKTAEQLSYKIVRPSQVTAQLIGPDGKPRVLEAGVQHDPGTYSFPWTTFDAEGTWHWNVSATDVLKRTSAIDRTFRYDTTLTGLTVPRLARGTAAIRFMLSRPASVRVQIETRNGVVLRALGGVSLPAGSQAVVWNGRLPRGTLAYGGVYLAHVFATSSVGTSDLSVQFSFRRTG